MWSRCIAHPVLVRQACATIDVLSEGRLLPAFGIGSPLAPEWRTLNLDTKTRGRKTDEGLEIIRRLWRENRSISPASTTICPAPRSCQSRCQPDLPMWIGGSSERRSGAPRGLAPAGRRAPRRRPRRAVIAAIRAAAAAEGRAIDDDHYGAGIPFRFGPPNDPGLDRLFEAYRKRTGRDPSAISRSATREAVVEHIAAYVAAGVSKFILRPAARGDDELLSQTRRLIEEVLPLVAARWPKPLKRSGPALAAQAAG